MEAFRPRQRLIRDRCQLNVDAEMIPRSCYIGSQYMIHLQFASKLRDRLSCRVIFQIAGASDDSYMVGIPQGDLRNNIVYQPFAKTRVVVCVHDILER